MVRMYKSFGGVPLAIYYFLLSVDIELDLSPFKAENKRIITCLLFSMIA
jgi:hypothetical protein